MKKSSKFMKKILISLTMVVLLVGMVGCSTTQKSKEEAVETKTVTDMRGKEVIIPKDPQNVAIFDKGFIVQSMVAMGIEEKIIASGGIIKGGEKATDRDSLYLYPKLLDLPNIGYPTDAVDYDAIAVAKPDLVILRNSEYIKDSEITKEAIDKIENELKIPLVVVNGPGCYEEVKLETHYEGVKLLGEVFDKQDRATEIIDLMKNQIAMIKEKTKDVKDEEKPSTMYLGLTGKDGVGVVWGGNFGDAKFSKEVANIKNVYDKHERMQMSAEQIIELNPDSIILCTNSVRPNPSILYEDEAYSSLRSVKAVANKQIGALGELTWWGDFRLEFPTILTISAKTVYPDKFEDVKVNKWLNEYHQELYGLTEEEAQELKEVQLLDWMDEKDF